MSLSENEVEIYWKLVSDVGDSDIEKALNSAVLKKEKSIKKLDGFFFRKCFNGRQWNSFL